MICFALIVIIAMNMSGKKHLKRERDDKNKPIFALNTITATIEKVPGLVVKLDEAEKTIAAELKSDSKMRGQGEKSIFEDNIDI